HRVRGTDLAGMRADVRAGSQTGPFRSRWHDLPQQACQSMTKREFEHGSRINTADEGTLERAVGSNILEIPNDGLISEPVTPSAAAFAPRIVTGEDIFLRGFVRLRHRHARACSRAGLC